MTTGEVIVARVAMKPLATLNRPVLATVDVVTKQETVSFKERTDVTAVPAAGVICETMVALVLAGEALRKFGGDSIDELSRNHRSYMASLAARMTHLVLVGLMGAGKTTIGRRCAEVLERPFVDTDDLAVVLAGRNFAELWAEGETTFRAWERRAVEEAAASPVPHVIACGGGAVVDPQNRRVLREHGVVVWLRARSDTLAARVGDGTGRPLLAGDPFAALARLEAIRAPAYEGAAHAVVDVDGTTIDEATASVLAAFATLDAAP